MLGIGQIACLRAAGLAYGRLIKCSPSGGMLGSPTGGLLGSPTGGLPSARLRAARLGSACQVLAFGRHGWARPAKCSPSGGTAWLAYGRPAKCAPSGGTAWLYGRPARLAYTLYPCIILNYIYKILYIYIYLYYMIINIYIYYIIINIDIYIYIYIYYI